MKTKYFFLPLLLLGLAFTGFAQSKTTDIEALRVAHYTKALSLTSEEAQKFWPVYNEYLQKKEDLRKNHLASMKTKQGNIDKLTDAEQLAMVDQELAYKQKDLDLQKNLVKQLKLILPAKKVALLFKAEEDFKKILIGMVKNSGK